MDEQGNAGAGGPRPIDRVRQHFAGEDRTLTIPEWKLTLHFGKVTLADIRGVRDRAPKDLNEQNVFLLISKARLDDGQPAFQMGDKHFLMTEADAMVMHRVINFMLEAAYTGVDEAKRAIEADPTSASGSTLPDA
jgi:hypothetical protein